MKNKLFRKVICALLSATLLFGAVGITSSAAGGLKYDPTDEHPYIVPSKEDMANLIGVLSYDEYRESYKDAVSGPDVSDFVINVVESLKPGSDAYRVSDSTNCQNSMSETPDNWVTFGDKADSSVYLPATGEATWNFDLPISKAGHYFIKIKYFNCITSESSVSVIERGFMIDGKIPFNEVSSITLDKSWAYQNVTTVVEDVADLNEKSYDVKYELVNSNDDSKGWYKIVTTVENGKKTVVTYKISQDINGNSMAPGAVAYPTWNEYYLQDASGYHSGYFSFYFANGAHEITLSASRDPVIIESITLEPATEQNEIDSYQQYLDKHSGGKAPTPVENGSIRIEAEFPDYISDSSVAPSNDNTSAITEPISSGAQLYNVIGETGYSAVGQWAAYKFRVKSTGFYNFGMRFKQSALQGMFVCRAFKLSGGEYGSTPVAPFLEAFSAEFDYHKDWQSSFVSAEIGRYDENGNPIIGEDGNQLTEEKNLMFYFEEGVEYTLYLECSLGTLKNYVQRVESTLNKINAAYLRILQLTGTDPDKNVTYNFFGVMPEVLITFLEESKELRAVKAGLEELCGTNGSHLATLETIALLLETMGVDNGIKIPENMSTLKSYLGTLGTWINSSKSGSMIVDSICVVPTVEGQDGPVSNDAALPKAKAGFFKSIWFEIKSFFYSFIVRYDQMGVTQDRKDSAKNVEVWLATGRDQSNVWRTMIDAKGSFTDSTGVAVNLKLVAGGTLLPSILASKGPDVYIGLGAGDVINYAIRDAVIGINGLDNKHLSAEENALFTSTYYTYTDAQGNILAPTTEYRGEENLAFVSNNFTDAVNGNFASAAMDTVTLLDKTYGIPQTMGFAMMFYRMDVLAELDQAIPESWDELLSLLPVLQSKNLSMGVAYINALDFMIYQQGGSMWKYTDSEKYDSKYAGAKVDLDSNVALTAFDYVCRLYSDYSLPVSYDAANRFRTGEMPIIIGDYASIYNQLTVFATEIGGLWGFCSLPGSENKADDGTVSFNYNSLASITATVIPYGCDDLLSSWQFIQWQTGEKAQADYGNRMVAIIGPSAKYETANLKAIDNLSWTASEKAAIMNQMDNMSSIVNYPGSYIINRYMQFAFLDAVNDDVDAIDAMTSYISAINTEIARKREEFGLWIPTDAEPEPPEKATAGKN